MTTLARSFLSQLRALLEPVDLLTDPADCWPYGYDNSRRHAPPAAVALPRSHDTVREIIRLCNTHHVAVVPRGRGTGTTGATVPTHGELVLSLERMNRIVRIDQANRYAVVEPGVTNQQVQDAVAQQGFFWPPDPTSAAYCSIGGNLAYNSAGPRAVKYGTPRDNVLGLRAVTGAGQEIRTGVFTTKGVVGYDLTRLLIGSEGTLAVITEATLKLSPVPEAKRTLRAIYSGIEPAAEAVASIMAQPIVPCSLEFMDAQAIAMIRDYSQVALPRQAGALLMIEVDGPAACIEHARERVGAAAQNTGLLELKTAATVEEVDQLWAMRKALSPALRKIAPKKINEDVVVPVSNIPALVNGLADLAREYNIKIVNFGHAGNGNIHVNLLIDPDDPEQAKSALLCLDRVFDLVLTLNGTLSGEHGIGLEKRVFIAREIEPATLGLMRGIKRQFDPNGLLNPGKMLPAREPEADA
ncbi:MAG: dimethylmenaquinone methyltransferase [Thiotrichales bacterium SG8_50]|nr:MAG: dimethylmenaquinone methyltransferase [Thiotrichales bacterium SG8_50]